MHTSADKTPNLDSQRVAPRSQEPQHQPTGNSFFDNRPATVGQRQQQEQLDSSPPVQQAAARQALLAQSSRLQPVAQFAARSGAAPVAAQSLANATGLPDSLKAGVENLSGYALDDVRVHYNSAQPAQLQAHAYAQGTDIHLAPGQEKHLPHEAWHIVQQKQGRVQPTGQTATGVALNDEAHLEAEASTQGAQASRAGSGGEPAVLQRWPLAPPARRPLRPHVAQRVARGRVGLQTRRPTAPADGPVVQLLATQIETKTEKGAEVIASVTVRGRPTSVYSGSMGDHTTAFIVHVEGLNVNLQGQTIAQALTFMEGLAGHLRELPGYESMKFDTGDRRIKTRYEAVEKVLGGHLAQAKATNNVSVRLHLLQEAIDAYLEARELIPFSTINVGEKSKGKAGKGHGESGPAAVLSNAEQLAKNKEKGWSKHSAVAAINALFDFQSAGMAATEVSESRLSSMTSGVAFAKRSSSSAALAKVSDPQQRLALMWKQHCLTIAKLYPNVYKSVEGELSKKDLKQTMTESINRDFGYLKDDAKRYIALLTKDHHLLKAEIKNKKLSNGTDIVMARAEQLNAVYVNQRLLLEVVEQMNLIDAIMEGTYTRRINYYSDKILEYKELDKGLPHFDPKRDAEPMTNTVNKWINMAEASRGENEEEIPDPKAIRKLGTLGSTKLGRPIEHFFSSQEEEDEEDSDSDSSEEEAEQKATKTEARVKSAEATTLSSALQSMSIQVLLDNAGVVTGMRSAGRPASPFANTMGAHSTAWTAHLDRVRALIRTKDIAAAYASMKLLADTIKAFYQGQMKKPLGRNAKGLINEELARMNSWQKIPAKSVSLSALQRFIEAILSFYNLIPDVSRDRIDTTGKGEGTYRERLLTYEATGVGTMTNLKEAINGLFDGRGRMGALWENHKQVIKDAYPYSYKFVFESEAHTGPTTSAPVIDLEDQEKEEEMKPLSGEQLMDMEAMADNEEWLAGQNNCLINAIAQANGLQTPPLAATVIAIRREIGAGLGTMLFASRAVLNVIVRHLGLHNGVVVVYRGDGYVDETTDLSAAPAYIYHDGINHFIPLSTLGPEASKEAKAKRDKEAQKKRKTEVMEEKSEEPKEKETKMEIEGIEETAEEAVAEVAAKEPGEEREKKKARKEPK